MGQHTEALDCRLTENVDCCYFYDDLSVYEDFGGVVLGSAEGEAIAQALGPSKMNVILQNHG